MIHWFGREAADILQFGRCHKTDSKLTARVGANRETLEWITNAARPKINITQIATCLASSNHQPAAMPVNLPTQTPLNVLAQR